MQARALVLERQHELSLRDIELAVDPGAHEVCVDVHTVGICGSDVHYYTHGRIGPFVVNAPMVLGHEAAGVVTAVGAAVTDLAVGERVCMEPGIPDMTSKAAKLGVYNVDPAVRFWATPPIHGCLTPSVVHPVAFTYKLPDNVSFAEGAMVEPLAVGMQATVKAGLAPGDVCVVTGAGPIGLVTALAALAGGASEVIVSDVVDAKLAIAARYDGVTAVNVSRESLADAVAVRCGADWGADVVFEASGNGAVYADALACVRPAGTVVLVGMPVEPVAIDVVAAQAKEIRIETVFRYANVYARAIGLLASGKIDVTPLITDTFAFDDSVTAFERAARNEPADVKLQIQL